MTILGLAFAALYLLAWFIKGRHGLLLIAALALPFQASAAVALGPLAITPFYLGMLAYLPLTLLSVIRSPSRINAQVKRLDVLLLALWFWCVIVTLIAPVIFRGIGVFSSAGGLDDQVGNLAELDFTSSNAAQLMYLTLNLLFLYAASRTGEVRFGHLVIAGAVGILTAFLAHLFSLGGIPWPDWLFMNNERNNYVETPRLRAQFSEASHLGAFALCFGTLFAIGAIVARRGRIASALLALIAGFLVIESAAASALIGCAISIGLFAIYLGRKALQRNSVINPSAALLGIGALMFLVISAPAVVGYARDVMEYKLARGTSITARGAADANSWDLFLETWMLGTGLGSNRSSSLLMMLLSTIGVVGVALFLVILVLVTRLGLSVGQLPATAALLALVSTLFVSYADFVSPALWVLIASILSAVARRSQNDSSLLDRRGDRPSKVASRAAR